MSLQSYILRKKIQFLYIRFIFYVKRNFDIKVLIGEPDTKDNLKKVYKQTIISKTLDHSKSIVFLILLGQESTALLHTRNLLETYLQARLLKELDSEAGYRSFWNFAAYSEYENLRKISEYDEDLIGQTFKEIIIKKIKDYEIEDPITKYLNELNILKNDFNTLFPQASQKPKRNYIWWAGLAPSKIAILFPDGALEMFVKLYWDISSDAHPNPRSNFNYILQDNPLYKGGNKALIMGLNLSIWIVQLYTKGTKQEAQMKSMMTKLNNILLKHHENERN